MPGSALNWLVGRYSTIATVSFVSMVRVPALVQLDCRLELPESVTVNPITWVHPLLVLEFPVNKILDWGMYTAPCIVDPELPVIVWEAPALVRLPKKRIPE